MHHILLLSVLLVGSACALEQRSTSFVRATASPRIVETEIEWDGGVRAAAGLEGKQVPLVDTTHIAGYFKLNRTHDAHMFYMLFESRNDASTDPVILWMTGGPGCSSELAVFYENGPYTIGNDMKLTETPFGWDALHTTIFVDQPVNVGFSYSTDPADDVYDEDQVAEDMLDFLQEFFEAHPELADRPFFVTGESYAGHYGPAVAHRVWKARKDGEGKPIALAGMAIGNGLTSPRLQFTSYADFGIQAGLFSEVFGGLLDLLNPVCSISADICNSAAGEAITCVIGNTLCSFTGMAPVLITNPGINVYDIRLTGDYDFSNADKFLNLPSTRKALGVGEREWEGCDAWIYEMMAADILKDYVSLVADLVNDGVPVMIYAGEQDLICNWLGNQRWLEKMEWSGLQEWLAAPEQPWTVGGKPAGSVKAHGALSFVKVAGAGHMVPMDQPENALRMISAFTRGQPLVAPS